MNRLLKLILVALTKFNVTMMKFLLFQSVKLQIRAEKIKEDPKK